MVFTGGFLILAYLWHPKMKLQWYEEIAPGPKKRVGGKFFLPLRLTYEARNYLKYRPNLILMDIILSCILKAKTQAKNGS